MSIIDRITRMLVGKANDVLDKAEDPGRDARQIVREFEDQISTATSSLLDAEAEYEIVRGKLDSARADVQKWTESAERAVRAGDDGLARECLAKVEEAEKAATSYAGTVETFNNTLNDLRARIHDLKRQKDGYAQRTELLEVRSHVAKAQESAAAAIVDIGSSSNRVGDFNRLEENVQRQEARARAAARMADQDSGKSLQDRVDALGTNSSIDDRLAAMKKNIRD